MKRARENAREACCIVPRYGAPATRVALNSFRTNTAVGLDLWGLREMTMLGDEALEELADIIAEMNQKAVPPLQVLGQITNLLGKKTGGHRCICTMASLYRLSCKLGAEAESEWNSDSAHEADSAQRGRGHSKRQKKGPLSKNC